MDWMGDQLILRADHFERKAGVMVVVVRWLDGGTELKLSRNLEFTFAGSRSNSNPARRGELDPESARNLCISQICHFYISLLNLSKGQKYRSQLRSYCSS